MRLRALALATTALLALPAATASKPTESQTFFEKALLADSKTTTGVKRLLRTDAGFVDPRSGFVDVTGDGRSDALVLVSTGGAAGNVALFVFSTHGQDVGDDDRTALRVIYRNQSLYRGTLRLSGSTITVITPKYAAGEELCCPKTLLERDYAFNESKRTFLRVDSRDVPRQQPEAPPAA